MKKQSQQ